MDRSYSWDAGVGKGRERCRWTPSTSDRGEFSGSAPIVDVLVRHLPLRRTEFQPGAERVYAREMAHLAVDAGADLVVAHHPHVLQGFEVYRGKLIAYSLGDFIFDKEEYETLPTVVLACRVGPEGVEEAYFHPAFIEDYVPKPVVGEAADWVVRLLAELSAREGTVVLPEGEVGRIVLDPSTGVEERTTRPISLPLRALSGGCLFYSEPVWLAPGEFLAGLDAEGEASVQVGTDLLVFGGFEADGATLWELNSQDEQIDSTVAWEGLQSLRLTRTNANTSRVQVRLKSKPPVLPERSYTLTGAVLTENAQQATVAVRWYQGRESGLIRQDDVVALTGTSPWTPFSVELMPPPEAKLCGYLLHALSP
ncbi:MAG: hypothetical protein KatS3mg115_1717 [Candidatus Poribacteria bacterium]|nr:MAG: hypothetical protein KatS3mg115_1717 [Candidatus Poribacteria bacterium]